MAMTMVRFSLMTASDGYETPYFFAAGLSDAAFFAAGFLATVFCAGLRHASSNTVSARSVTSVQVMMRPTVWVLENTMAMTPSITMTQRIGVT